MLNATGGFQIDAPTLQSIWSACDLGTIRSTDWAGKGQNNPALVINDTHVIRFDGLINKGLSRFHGERLAYDRLRAAGIPAPQVLVLDDSRSLAPYDFMIMNKIAGRPLIDDWPSLTGEKRQQAATEAGRILAQMHTISFPQFGRLYGTERVFANWPDSIMDKFYRDGWAAVSEGNISAAICDRMQAVLTHHHPTFASVTTASLVHWDYHFGNLLQEDGTITGVLDFEWALAGDPAYDFDRREQWDEDCPGSRQWVYDGYISLRPLDADHDTRVSLYEMIWLLDCVVDARDAAEADTMCAKLIGVLQRLET
ncbi:MAG: phosphotransferase [Anaerolineae bacterium]